MTCHPVPSLTVARRLLRNGHTDETGERMTLYRMELDDETGEPFYEPITPSDLDLAGLESAAMARIKRFMPQIEAVVDHPPGCEACVGVAVRHTILEVLDSFRCDDVCIHGVPLKHAHCCPPE